MLEGSVGRKINVTTGIKENEDYEQPFQRSFIGATVV
jgi:hypothetical protein